MSNRIPSYFSTTRTTVSPTTTTDGTGVEGWIVVITTTISLIMALTTTVLVVTAATKQAQKTSTVQQGDEQNDGDERRTRTKIKTNGTRAKETKSGVYNKNNDTIKLYNDNNSSNNNNNNYNNSTIDCNTICIMTKQSTLSESLLSTTEHTSSTNDNKRKNAYNQLIGNTPLIYLPNLSKLVQRNIYVKMECYNPSGTGKDRAVYNMISKAVVSTVFEKAKNSDTNDYHNNQTKESVSKTKVMPSNSTNDGEQLLTNNNNNTTQQSSDSNTTTARNGWNQPQGNDDIKKLQDYYQLINKAKERSQSGIIIIEGSSGSTGIAVANQCIGLGHSCIIVVPDDQAIEKQRILQSFPCCCLYVVPTAAISNPNHYVNIAKYITYLINTTTTTSSSSMSDSEQQQQQQQQQQQYRAIFLNQFENLDNYIIHYEQTGPELYEQFHNYIGTNQSDFGNRTIDAFIMSAGTGGTIAGIGHYLKEQYTNVRIVLADPIGSSLGNKIRYGIAFTTEQCERTIQKHRYDTIVEGVGLDRITANFTIGIPIIDTAVTVTDQEAIDIAHYILQHEGLFIGSSTAINIVATIRTALALPPTSNLITIVCDTGFRHLTRFWNPDYISKERNLIWPPYSDTPRIPECLQSIIISK